MKKGILLWLLIFLLTGCTVNYDLKIESNKIEENISGSISKDLYEIKETDTDVNIFYSIINFDQYPLLKGNDVYHKTIVNTEDGVDYNFKYKYNNNFDQSRLLNTCFENVVFKESDQYYYVKLSGDFYCLYSDQIVINVNTKYVVFDHNADKVKNNTYTWIIDDNSTEINATISKEIINDLDDVKNKPNYFRIVSFVVLIVLSLITYLLYKKKNSNKN